MSNFNNLNDQISKSNEPNKPNKPNNLKQFIQSPGSPQSQSPIIDVDLLFWSDIKKQLSGNWFSRVYLCCENIDFTLPDTFSPIKGFKCIKHNSFESADLTWNKDLVQFHSFNFRHTMIPVCKWVPEFFDKYILNWKLKNLYWQGRNSIETKYTHLMTLPYVAKMTENKDMKKDNNS